MREGVTNGRRRVRFCAAAGERSSIQRREMFASVARGQFMTSKRKCSAKLMVDGKMVNQPEALLDVGPALWEAGEVES